MGWSKAKVHTNAPRHWPSVAIRKWDEANPWNNITEIATPIVEGLRSSPPPKVAARKLLLFDDGILEVPLFIEDGGEPFAVFGFAVVDEETAGFYSAVRTLLKQRRGIQAVYYASEPLRPAAPRKALQQLDSPHFSALSDARPDAEYATWWPTEEDPKFADSPARGFLNRWFTAFDGYGAYPFSAFAHDLELVSEETALVGLPAQTLLEGMRGPGDLEMCLLASMETGILLAFDTSRSTAKDRNTLLKLAAEFAEGLRAEVESRGLPSDARESGKALEFWRRTEQQALEIEASGGDLQIGHVLEAGPSRASHPGASDSTARRAAMGSRPSPGLSAFAMAEMDAAVKRVRAMVAEYGIEGPHLHPFVSMQRGEQVRRVAILLGEEPDVVAAAPQLLLEHHGSGYASVAYDGFLTLGNDRCECIYLLAHEKGADEAFLTAQRYVAGEGKVGLTGSELLIGPGTRLFGQACVGEVRPAHDALAKQALEELQRWLAIGPPEHVDGNSELFSCLLNYGAGAQPKFVRFMMMSRLAGEAKAIETLAGPEGSQASWATITSDEVATDGKSAARCFRFRVQERGDAFSSVYHQRYTARARKPVELAGGLERVAFNVSLFP